MRIKLYGVLALTFLFAIATAQFAFAADTGAKSSTYGQSIRKAEISGFTLSYYLLDVVEKHATSVMPSELTSSDFSKMKSHHLMVFVTRPGGRPATEGKAGFLVVHPNKTETRDIAVAMDGGFGSDVDLPAKGDYTIITKIVLSETDLLDNFVYTVK